LLNSQIRSHGSSMRKRKMFSIRLKRPDNGWLMNLKNKTNSRSMKILYLV
jgi:hypothetical protein